MIRKFLTLPPDFIAQLLHANPNSDYSLKRILVLDDDEDVLSVVEEILTYEHFIVHGLRRSNGLLAAARAFRPDLFLIDFRLSDGNGGALCRLLKADHEFKDTAVIIFSAYTHPDMDLNQYGCDAVIAKPFDLIALTSTIHSLLNPNGKAVA